MAWLCRGRNFNDVHSRDDDGPALAGRAVLPLCGLAVARVTKGNGTAAKILGIVVTAIFIPVHYGLWDKFPVWYHAIFIASLFPFTLLGAKLLRRRNPTAQIFGN